MIARDDPGDGNMQRCENQPDSGKWTGGRKPAGKPDGPGRDNPASAAPRHGMCQLQYSVT